MYVLNITLIPTPKEFIGEERVPGQIRRSSWIGLIIWLWWKTCPERSWPLQEHRGRAIPPSHGCLLPFLKDTALVSAIRGTCCEVNQVWTRILALWPEFCRLSTLPFSHKQNENTHLADFNKNYVCDLHEDLSTLLLTRSSCLVYPQRRPRRARSGSSPGWLPLVGLDNKERNEWSPVLELGVR